MSNGKCFIVPPEWIIEPKDVNVVRDDQAEVNCSASGHPKPTIKWRKGSSNKTWMPRNTFGDYILCRFR